MGPEVIFLATCLVKVGIVHLLYVFEGQLGGHRILALGHQVNHARSFIREMSVTGSGQLVEWDHLGRSQLLFTHIATE